MNVSSGTLPGNLNDALRHMRKDKVIVNALGKEFADLYDNIKKAEWNEYMKQVSDWELNRYLVKM